MPPRRRPRIGCWWSTTSGTFARSSRSASSRPDCEVREAGSAEAALAALASAPAEMAFVDLRLGSTSGLDLLPALLAEDPDLDVVVITAYAAIDTAMEAVRRGARDYLPKPFTPAQIRAVVERLRERRRLRARVEMLEDRLAGVDPDALLETRSAAMQASLALLRRAAASDATVLLRGENGTGKSVLARALHRLSPRSEKPFVTVSAPTLSDQLLVSELFGHARGSLHRSGARRSGAGRGRGGGHALPRRDRRARPRHPGPAPALPPGEGLRARGRDPDAPRGRAHRVGHQPRARGRRPLGALPRGPALPAQRGGDPRPVAPRAPGGHPPPGPADAEAVRRVPPPPGPGARSGIGRGARALRLAGQRARASQRGGARGHRLARGHPSPCGLPGANRRDSVRAHRAGRTLHASIRSSASTSSG